MNCAGSVEKTANSWHVGMFVQPFLNCQLMQEDPGSAVPEQVDLERMRTVAECEPGGKPVNSVPSWS